MPALSDDAALVVLCTAGDADSAASLARALVDARVAACVNVVPGLRSIYRWQDAVHDDAEVLLIVKTTVGRFDALQAEIRRRHPYDTPEILALEAARIDPRYAAWLIAALGDEPEVDA